MAKIVKGGSPKVKISTPTNTKTGMHLQKGMPSPPRTGPGSFK